MPINYPDNVKHNNSAFPIISASDLTVQGWYHVANTTERDAVPAAKRLTGAVVVVDTTVYVYTGGALDDTSWQTSGNWAAVTTGSLSWGSIAGTLANQTDLQSALDAKANSSHTHVLADITDSGNLAALDTVGTSEIDDDAVTKAKIAFQAVDSSEIAPDAIVTSKIADLAVQGIKLGDSSVSAAKLANNAVEEAKISNNAVTSIKLANNSVTEPKIAPNSVTEAKLFTGAVTNSKLATDSVSTSKIRDGDVTDAKLAQEYINTTTATQTKAGNLRVRELSIDRGPFRGTQYTYGDDMPVIDGFYTVPKGYGDGGRGFEFRFDTTQTAYLMHETGATWTQVLGTAPSTSQKHSLFTAAPGYFNVFPLVDSNDEWSFEVTGFTLSNSSNTSWKPIMFFHSGLSTSINLKVEFLAGDGTTWVTAHDDPVSGSTLFPANYKTVSPGNLKGMRFTISNVTTNLYLKQVGATSKTSPSFAWQMLKQGGSFYGDLRAKKDGNTTWTINQTGSANFTAITQGGNSLGNLAFLSTVDRAQIAFDAINDARIADGAVTTNKIQNGAITTAKIIDGNITTAKLGAAAVTVDKINNSAVTTDKIADLNVTTSKLATGSVTGPKLATSSVSTTRIEDAAVTTVKIANSAITTDKLAIDAVTGPKIADGAVSTARIEDAAVNTVKIANSAITTDKLAIDAVTGPKIADSAVSTARIEDGAVNTVKIGDQVVTNSKLALNSVSTSRLQDSSVTAAKIVDGNVTNAKLQNGAVDSDQLAIGAVTYHKIGSGAVADWQLNPNLEGKLLYNGGAQEPLKPWNGQTISGAYFGFPRKPLNTFYNCRFLGRSSELHCTLNGSTLSESSKNAMFNQVWSSVTMANAGDPDAVLNINFTTNGLTSSNGFTYSQGWVLVSFYYTWTPTAMTARTKDRNGNWTTRTVRKEHSANTQNQTHINSWSVQLGGNYVTDIELTMTPQSSDTGNRVGVSNISYFGTRMNLAQGPLVTCLGGEYYGDLSGVSQGTTNWTIDQDGSADFDSLTVQGSPITSGADGADGLGFTGGSYSAATGVVTFTSDDGLGFFTGDLRGADGADGATGPQGPAGADGADGADGTSVVLQGSVSTVANLPSGAAAGDLWVVTADGDGYVSDGAGNWSNVGAIQGPAGADGDGFTGGSYNASTGVVTFTSDDGLGFSTGDLRGADGADGADGATGATGPQGPAGADGSDGLPGANGTAGADGDGFTGGSYNASTGVVTFTSDDGLGFSTGDLRGADGADGATGPQGPAGADGSDGLPGANGTAGDDGDGFTGGSYNASTGVVTFTSDDGLGFSTSDLRGADGADGAKGDTGDTGPTGPQGAEGATGPQGPAGANGTNGTNGSDGADGAGFTGGSYNSSTGVVTFTSDDALGFSTGDLRGADGADGATGPQGPAGTNGTDGTNGTNGIDGLGFTGGSYNAATGVVTFTSDDALGFSTGDLRGADGADGADGSDGLPGANGTPGSNGADGDGFTGGSYNAATGVVTFTSDDGLGFSTGDLRGADGAKGDTGDTGPTGPQGAEGAAGADGADGSDALALAGNNQTLTGNRTIDDGNTGKLFFIDLEAASGEKSQVLMNPNTPSIFLQAHDGTNVSAFTIGSANINLQFTNTSDLRVNNDEGTSGQVLTSNGTGSAPTWEYPEALHIPRWNFADFNALQATSNSPFVGAASTGGNTNGAVNGDAFTTTGSGWVMIRAGTGGTSGYRWDTQQPSTNFQAGMSYVCIFNTHANSTDRKAWFGFKDTTLNVQSNQGVYYTLDGLTLTATVDRSTGTIDTGTGQTLSANTTYMVEIKANSGSSFTFYLYAAPTGNQPGALIHSETLTMSVALNSNTNMRVGMAAVRTTTGTANYELLALDYMGFGYR